MRLLGLFITSSLALAAWAMPSTAHAIEVDCQNEYGSCTVSNDPVDFFSCQCTDESGTGGSGVNEWSEFDAQMLLEICESELEFCSYGETDGGTDGSTTTFGTGGMTTTTTTDGSETASTTVGDTSPATTGAGSDTTGDDSAGETTTSTSGGSATGSDTTSGGATGADTTSGGATGAGTTSGGGADPEATAGSNEDPDTDDGGAGADDDGGLADRGSCSVAPGRPLGLSLLLLGLLGLRRRR